LSISLNDPAPTATDTLSLHDALPISISCSRRRWASLAPINSRVGVPWATWRQVSARRRSVAACLANRSMRSQALTVAAAKRVNRSEEHTSELQSRENLVCRLLLEKKK